MKFLCVLFVLLVTTASAQDSDRILQSIKLQLSSNGAVPRGFYYGTKREAVRLDTMMATAPNFRLKAFSHLWQQDYEQAVDWLEKMAALFPKEHDTAGELYLSTFHDYPRALRHFDAYGALTPAFDDIVGYNPVSYLKGLAWRGLGNHEKAIQQFSIAIDSLVSKHGAEWVSYKQFVSRAISYIATQQPEKALLDLDKATANFPRSALVHYHRGRALLLINRPEQARTAFQDASFFVKALRAERTGDYLEDDFNPVYEAEIEETLERLKN